MGRRSINTTKSGKFMNPTDQARKEARKRELKKNKKQRMMVRAHVLKMKDPIQIIQDMEELDELELNPETCSHLGEKVIKDKRKKLKETLDRVLKLYQKEDPDRYADYKRAEMDYDKKRQQHAKYYESIRETQQVNVDSIPLPDAPEIPSMIPLPKDIPLPGAMPPSILKKTSAYEQSASSRRVPGPPPGLPPGLPPGKRPPGPPPGLPPWVLEKAGVSDDADDNEGNSDIDDEQPYHPEEDVEDMMIGEHPDAENSEGDENEMDEDGDEEHDIQEDDEDQGKRSVRFADEDNKSEQLRIPKGMTALQAKMLKLAGQLRDPLPHDDVEDNMSDDEGNNEQGLQERDENNFEDKQESKDTSEISQPKSGPPTSLPPGQASRFLPPGAPPNPPQGPPPRPPPGFPPGMGMPNFNRPPPLRTLPPGMLPPGPPPGRPPAPPPGPPPGMPPLMRSAMPRIPPPSNLRPPRGLPPPPGTRPVVPPVPQVSENPNVLSAPPSIHKLPTRQEMLEKMPIQSATIEAKPQLRNLQADVTRFMPTSLRVKRDAKAKSKTSKSGPERNEIVVAPAPKPTVSTATKDDAYEQFMREMENFL
ncbi:WW domain-binding protein 11-like [Anneissia japonica]|uniref:WW domain-binding protein 11-like n=1 Tax=Anneissia japonica TaxID=1529436 RepID=UPI001425A183|nr:WW domain-binding protein 11-like [Anneissia japonica]